MEVENKPVVDPATLLPVAKRPDPGGRAGRPIRLVVNHFELRTAPAATFFHQYDVEIERVMRPKMAAPEGVGSAGPVSSSGGAGSSSGPPAGAPTPMETDATTSTEFDKEKSKRGFALKGAAAIPPEQNRRVYDAIAEGQLADALKLTAYDGRKIMYSVRDIKEITDVWYDVDAPNEDGQLDKFQIKFQHATAVSTAAFEGWLKGDVDIFPQDLVSSFDIAMRQKRATDPRFLTWGSSYYELGPARVGDLGEGCSAWRGYYQSVRATQSGLTINIDVSHSAFFDPQPVIEFAKKLLLPRGGQLPSSLSRDQKAQLTTALKTLRVKTTHGHKISYKVFRLGDSPREATIPRVDDNTGGNITIEQYFQDKYNIRLQYPDLPCIVATRKDNHIPMELCAIPDGIRRNRLLSPQQTASMIRVAAMKPQPRLQYAAAAADKADFTSDPVCKAFGIEVKKSQLEVQGRILPPPEIKFAEGGNKIRPSNGAWRMPPRVPYFRASCRQRPLMNWGVIKYDRGLRLDDAQRFVVSLIRTLRERGITVANERPRVFELDRANPSSVPGDLARVRKDLEREFDGGPGVQLLLIMVRFQDTPMYNAIKKGGDCELGIPTQVMLTKHATREKQRGLGAYTDNIALKINVKLGGSNFTPVVTPQSGTALPFENQPFMVVGADVTHPPPGSKAFPSIAAMVGSMDRWFGSHYGSYRSQEPGVERADDSMHDMLKEILLRFHAVNQRLPEVIVMFRDGVSEGQFLEVMNREVEAMRRAFKGVGDETRRETYRPKIVYIVVQKRHHTRFSTASPQDADRSGNVPAGTVIDQGVCHPKEFDYYLFSHSGLQGTSVPAHYHVLFDEIGLGSDAVQSFSYRLCHSFARASRSVSLPAPTYYAHLLAYRARCFVPDPTASTGGTGSSGTSAGGLTNLANVHARMKPTMHFI